MRRAGAIFSILVSLWVIAIGAGMSMLMRYDYTPGATSIGQLCWPNNSQISLSTDRPTLIMFAHPQCPCTKASIAELGELVAACKSKFKAYVLLFNPKSIPDGWDKTALRREAENISGVTVLSDLDGIEAQKFHSVTSGQTMIFNPKGRLLFSGGITNARGQIGNNSSLNSAKLALEESPLPLAHAPVFGCSLLTTKK